VLYIHAMLQWYCAYEIIPRTRPCLIFRLGLQDGSDAVCASKVNFTPFGKTSIKTGRVGPSLGDTRGHTDQGDDRHSPPRGGNWEKIGGSLMVSASLPVCLPRRGTPVVSEKARGKPGNTRHDGLNGGLPIHFHIPEFVSEKPCRRLRGYERSWELATWPVMVSCL
jgi:hypothetical protein